MEQPGSGRGSGEWWGRLKICIKKNNPGSRKNKKTEEGDKEGVRKQKEKHSSRRIRRRAGFLSAAT